MKLVPSKRFDQDLKKLLGKKTIYKAKVRKTLLHLKDHPHHPSLRLHKLAGTNNYSVSVDMSVRIILHRNEDTAFLLRIGTHDDVYIYNGTMYDVVIIGAGPRTTLRVYGVNRLGE